MSSPPPPKNTNNGNRLLVRPRPPESSDAAVASATPNRRISLAPPPDLSNLLRSTTTRSALSSSSLAASVSLSSLRYTNSISNNQRKLSPVRSAIPPATRTPISDESDATQTLGLARPQSSPVSLSKPQAAAVVARDSVVATTTTCGSPKGMPRFGRPSSRSHDLEDDLPGVQLPPLEMPPGGNTSNIPGSFPSSNLAPPAMPARNRGSFFFGKSSSSKNDALGADSDQDSESDHDPLMHDSRAPQQFPGISTALPCNDSDKESLHTPLPVESSIASLDANSGTPDVSGISPADCCTASNDAIPPAADATANPTTATVLTPERVEDIQENARTLRTVAQAAQEQEIDVCLLQTLYELCQLDQRLVRRVVDDSSETMDDQLDKWLTLHDLLADAMSLGEETMAKLQQETADAMPGSDVAAVASAHSLLEQEDSHPDLSQMRESSTVITSAVPSDNSFGVEDEDDFSASLISNQVEANDGDGDDTTTNNNNSTIEEAPPPTSTAPSSSRTMEVSDLVANQDVFSLICLLRAPRQEKRFEAAMALMGLARDEARGFAQQGQTGQPDSSYPDPASTAGSASPLRNEIRSSGGLQSLLTLFRAPTTMRELKIVTALAIAHVIPSWVQSANGGAPSIRQALRITQCLRYLASTGSQLCSDGTMITGEETWTAAVMVSTDSV
jgi:hypothetical protein